MSSRTNGHIDLMYSTCSTVRCKCELRSTRERFLTPWRRLKPRWKMKLTNRELVRKEWMHYSGVCKFKCGSSGLTLNIWNIINVSQRRRFIQPHPIVKQPGFSLSPTYICCICNKYYYICSYFKKSKKNVQSCDSIRTSLYNAPI